MITGTITYQVTVQEENEEKMQELSTRIEKAVNAIDGASDCEEIESDLDDSGDPEE